MICLTSGTFPPLNSEPQGHYLIFNLFSTSRINSIQQVMFSFLLFSSNFWVNNHYNKKRNSKLELIMTCYVVSVSFVTLIHYRGSFMQWLKTVCCVHTWRKQMKRQRLQLKLCMSHVYLQVNNVYHFNNTISNLKQSCYTIRISFQRCASYSVPRYTWRNWHAQGHSQHTMRFVTVSYTEGKCHLKIRNY